MIISHGHGIKWTVNQKFFPISISGNEDKKANDLKMPHSKGGNDNTINTAELFIKRRLSPALRLIL